MYCILVFKSSHFCISSKSRRPALPGGAISRFTSLLRQVSKRISKLPDKKRCFRLVGPYLFAFVSCQGLPPPALSKQPIKTFNLFNIKTAYSAARYHYFEITCHYFQLKSISLQDKIAFYLLISGPKN